MHRQFVVRLGAGIRVHARRWIRVQTARNAAAKHVVSLLEEEQVGHARHRCGVPVGDVAVRRLRRAGARQPRRHGRADVRVRDGRQRLCAGQDEVRDQRRRGPTTVTARQSGGGTAAPRAWAGEPDNQHRCAEHTNAVPRRIQSGIRLRFGWWASLQGRPVGCRARKEAKDGRRTRGQTARED